MFEFRPLAVRICLSPRGYFKTSFSHTKLSKHGSTSLLVAGHDPPLDITIFMDIELNPGPSNASSFDLSARTVNDYLLHSSISPSLITYSRNELFSYRKCASNNNLSSTFAVLKDLKIFRYRGNRGGRWKSSSVDRCASLNSSSSAKCGNPPADNFLNFCLLNTRSINNKSLHLKDLTIDENIDILAFTETWLKTNDSNSDFASRDICPHGYSFVHCPRMDRSGGGIGLLFNKSIMIKRILSGLSYSSFEHMEFNLHGSSFLVRFVVVYRPPSTSRKNSTTSKFFQDFTTFLESVSTFSGKLLIVGDFNFHVDNPKDYYAARFLDLLDFFGLSIMNTLAGPTHKNNHILDLLITRNDDLLVNNVYVRDPVLSDHFAVHCKLAIAKPRAPMCSVTYRKISSINMDHFRRDLSQSSITTISCC